MNTIPRAVVGPLLFATDSNLQYVQFESRSPLNKVINKSIVLYHSKFGIDVLTDTDR